MHTIKYSYVTLPALEVVAVAHQVRMASSVQLAVMRDWKLEITNVLINVCYVTLVYSLLLIKISLST